MRSLNVHPVLPIVTELDGFLNAIRCVMDCPRRLFTARLLEKNVSVEDIIQRDVVYIEDDGRVFESTAVGSSIVYGHIVEYVYKRLSKSKTRATDNLDWNLIEYFGLISTADEKDGPWNRLLSQDHHMVKFVDGNDCESIMFYVEFSDFLVAVQLGVSWNGKKI